MSVGLQIPESIVTCKNLVDNIWQIPHGAAVKVNSPYSGEAIGLTYESTNEDVDSAVQSAQKGFEAWRDTPIKERSLLLYKLRNYLLDGQQHLANTAALESGKTLGEARAEVLKGVEVLEYALSLQNLDQGATLEVSRGVTCKEIRVPLGVTIGIVPFNFPAMVPFWMIPISIALGNAFILKPSEKVPLTSQLMGQAFLDCGFPAGVFSIVNGRINTVQSLIKHPLVQSIGFVGSSPAAKAVYQQATALGKRCLALGGAKNHIILAPDAQPDITVGGIVNSFTGCAGQRCMAASVVVAVGDVDHLIEAIVAKASALTLGSDMGALISDEARQRLVKAIDQAEAEGAKILLDGRKTKAPMAYPNGFWLGPTIIDHVRPGSEAATCELFGPVLSVIRVDTISQALALEHSSRFGNATSVFTQSGAIAELVVAKSSTGMIGVNIGVPVPREPFSFGGTKDSKFGQGDITGDASLDLWSNLKKVTTKWAQQQDANWMS